MGAQVRLAVRPVDQRRDRYRPFAVPESVEDVRQVPDHGTTRGDVEVAEVGSGVHLEVGIAHVAPADDRQRVVHHHELVVHAMVDAVEVNQEPEEL